MAKQTIDLGTQGTQSGDTIRTAFDKSNNNFSELYNQLNKAGVYSGSLGSTYVQTSGSSWVYGSAFGDSLPAGTYLIIGRAIINTQDITYPGDMIARPGLADQNNNIVANSYAHVFQNGVLTVQIFNIWTFTGSATLKPAILKQSGSGTARAGYYYWTAIKVSEL